MRIIFLLLLSVTLTGCATVVHGTTQKIPIASSPPGATVLIDDVPVGVTPMVATLSRTRRYVRAQFGSTFEGVRRLPMSEGARATATTSASMIGFGAGHAALDLPAKRFLLLDLAASTAMIGGFIAGYGGSDAGAAVFFTGGAVFIGSRIWQIADLAKRIDSNGR